MSTQKEKLRIKNKLFTEKYRPVTLEDIIGHDEIIKRLQAFVGVGNSLEFLFSGPAATGKTASAVAFARDLFGENWKRNFTELNASDERGIDIVRNKIKLFAGSEPVNAAFKIIFLDEVDELCLPAGTIILVGAGAMRRYESIENISQMSHTSIQSVNLETGEIEKDFGICVDSGYADFYKLTLFNGKTVTASEKHPFFTKDRKEIKMRDIEVGTKILDYSVKLGLEHVVHGKMPNDCELIEVVAKTHIGNGKAYNISMKKNPCFFLHNGILTHNTNAAQSALRRTIEVYADTCRFILACNDESKLIAPIKSRLMHFHFAGLVDEDMKTLALKVIEKEGLVISDEAINLLVELSDKDTRVVLNTLQVCALLGGEIGVESVRNTLQVPEKKHVLHMINSAIKGDLDLSFEICENSIINSGFDSKKIIKMIDKNISTLDAHQNTKCKMLDIISDTEDRINRGGTPHIQLRGLLSKFQFVSSIPAECPAMVQQ